MLIDYRIKQSLLFKDYIIQYTSCLPWIWRSLSRYNPETEFYQKLRFLSRKSAEDYLSNYLNQMYGGSPNFQESLRGEVYNQHRLGIGVDFLD